MDADSPSRKGWFEDDSEDEEISVQAPAQPTEDPPQRRRANTVQTQPATKSTVKELDFDLEQFLTESKVPYSFLIMNISYRSQEDQLSKFIASRMGAKDFTCTLINSNTTEGHCGKALFSTNNIETARCLKKIHGIDFFHRDLRVVPKTERPKRGEQSNWRGKNQYDSKPYNTNHSNHRRHNSNYVAPIAKIQQLDPSIVEVSPTVKTEDVSPLQLKKALSVEVQESFSVMPKLEPTQSEQIQSSPIRHRHSASMPEYQEFQRGGRRGNRRQRFGPRRQREYQRIDPPKQAEPTPQPAAQIELKPVEKKNAWGDPNSTRSKIAAPTQAPPAPLTTELRSSQEEDGFIIKSKVVISKVETPALVHQDSDDAFFKIKTVSATPSPIKIAEAVKAEDIPPPPSAPQQNEYNGNGFRRGNRDNRRRGRRRNTRNY